jgi:hypothetical protein
MNSMNDQRFFDLAMKSIARQSTDAERAELDALLARHPELKAEWEKLQADARLAREVAPLVAATQATGGEFPAYARERLQTKVRRTLSQERPAARKTRWGWVLGLAGAAAVVLLLVLPATRPPAPRIEVALLDTAGAVRGAETNDLEVLKQRWAGARVQSFDQAADLETWRMDRTQDRRPVVKVIYDRTAGELRVWVFGVGKDLSKTISVERDLAMALQEADSFIREQVGR